MARPRKVQPEESQEVTAQIKNVSDKEYQDLVKEIQSLKQDKEQLERKLVKRSSTPQDRNTAQAKSDLSGIEAMREEDSQLVKGIFRCFNPPGGNLTFYFKKYKGDPIQKYEMFDGQEYEVPLAVAKHLNENCFEDDHAYLLDANGNPIVGMGKRNHRFAFSPSKFGDKLAPKIEGKKQLAFNEV